MISTVWLFSKKNSRIQKSKNIQKQPPCKTEFLIKPMPPVFSQGTSEKEMPG